MWCVLLLSISTVVLVCNSNSLDTSTPVNEIKPIRRLGTVWPIKIHTLCRHVASSTDAVCFIQRLHLKHPAVAYIVTLSLFIMAFHIPAKIDARKRGFSIFPASQIYSNVCDNDTLHHVCKRRRTKCTVRKKKLWLSIVSLLKIVTV